MMKFLKSDLHTVAAALTLGALSVGFAPSAAAVSSFDAYSEISITLLDVTAGGVTTTTGWDVTAEGFGSTVASGGATAAVSVVGTPPVSLGIGDTITQWASASGTRTTPGVASGDAGFDLSMFFVNNSQSALTFTVQYDAMWSTAASADDALSSAWASSDAVLFDDATDYLLGFSDSMANSSVSNADSATGVLSFTVLTNAPDGFLGGFGDAFGEATVVPVPAAVWLFGTGLLGLIAVARRKQAA